MAASANSPGSGLIKGQQNRERIVAAATALFGARGYSQTSIGDVAEQAGLRKGNLSYYFKTKADMLECVVQARRDELFGRITAALPPQASAHESLEQFLCATAACADELAQYGCPVGTLCSELGKDDPTLQPFAARILEDLDAWLTQQFARLVPPKRAGEYAEHLLALLQGAAVLAHAYHDPALVHRQVHMARQWLQSTLPDALRSGDSV